MRGDPHSKSDFRDRCLLRCGESASCWEVNLKTRSANSRRSSEKTLWLASHWELIGILWVARKSNISQQNFGVSTWQLLLNPTQTPGRSAHLLYRKAQKQPPQRDDSLATGSHLEATSSNTPELSWGLLSIFRVQPPLQKPASRAMHSADNNHF